jgi:hypothetical protein
MGEIQSCTRTKDGQAAVAVRNTAANAIAVIMEKDTAGIAVAVGANRSTITIINITIIKATAGMDITITLAAASTASDAASHRAPSVCQIWKSICGSCRLRSRQSRSK